MSEVQTRSLVDVSLFFMNKMKMKQQIRMLQLHLFISDMRSNFAESDNSF